MNILALKCEEIDTSHEGYVVVHFSVVPLDETVYVSSSISIQIFSAENIEVGKLYDLALKEIAE